MKYWNSRLVKQYCALLGNDRKQLQAKTVSYLMVLEVRHIKFFPWILWIVGSFPLSRIITAHYCYSFLLAIFFCSFSVSLCSPRLMRRKETAIANSTCICIPNGTQLALFRFCRVIMFVYFLLWSISKPPFYTFSS